MNTPTDASSEPVSGPVERPVRPAAWMWQTVESGTRVSLSEPADYEEVRGLQPLFGNDEMAAAVAEDRKRLLDLAMMLRTCAWALRRGSAPELGERALELLKRHELLGSPLRA